MANRTDFEAFGFTSGTASPAHRSWLLTVDFEAFRAETIRDWCLAMATWSAHASRSGLRFSFFIAVENVLAVRARQRVLYDEFLGALMTLQRSGAVFYPHNHWLFDTDSGERPISSESLPVLVPGYRKRPSMFYDVVHRHKVDLRSWLVEVHECFGSVLADAAIDRPLRPTFRAGGWDYGSTEDEIATYIDALRRAQFAIDSSAVAGDFGTSSWHVGAPFGSNIFWLAPDLLEVAPVWSINCGAPAMSRDTATSVLDLLSQRLLWSRHTPGALVTVLHFDHLFRPARGRPPDANTVNRRIGSLFTQLKRLQVVLGTESKTFDDLTLSSP